MKRANIDYLRDCGRPNRKLGIVELIDLDAALFGGEASAAALAADFGLNTATVQRRRAALRKKGRLIPVPESEGFTDYVRSLRVAR